MTFIKFLARLCPHLLLLAIVASLASGLSTVGLLAFTMHLLKGGASPFMPWQAAFAALCVLFILSRMAAWFAMAYIDSRAVTELRTRLIQQIAGAPLLRLETAGASRLLTTLTSDVATMSSALPRLVSALTSATLLIGYLAYMTWISAAATALVMGIVAVGASLHGLFGLGGRRYFVQAGQAWDRFAQNLEGLIRGIKQLKLNALRRNRFVGGELPASQAQFQKMKMLGSMMSTFAVNWAQLSFVTALGVLLMLFLVREERVATSAVEFTFVFVCLMGPLETLLLTAGSLRDASVGFERVQALGLVLPIVMAKDESRKRPAAPMDWKCVRLKGIEYAYQTDRAFTVGPIDLVLDREQIIFVVGGNGSGKSTFAKLLTSLYTPDRGEIYIDDTPIDEASRDWYGQQFSAVFDDDYLFNRLADGTSASETPTRDYLRVLGLDERLAASDEISIAAKGLSFGQKKRLALVSALLEDRPIYVFDEWAAQQDEKLRDLFYRKLLPHLRDRGKLVVVITHDDGYEHVADRILRFRDGKLAA